MTIEQRFNKILNNLERTIDKNKPSRLDNLTEQELDEKLAKMTISLVNEWLDKGFMFKIENNRLKLLEKHANVN